MVEILAGPQPPTPPQQKEYYSLTRCGDNYQGLYATSTNSGFLNNGQLVQGAAYYYHVTYTAYTPPAGRSEIQVSLIGYGPCP